VPEHEATGQVLWVELDKIVQVFLLLRSGASTLGSYKKKLLRHGDLFSLQGYAGNPIIFKQLGSQKEPDILPNNWFAKNPIYIKHTSEQ
jgi:hypothetical protein